MYLFMFFLCFIADWVLNMIYLDYSLIFFSRITRIREKCSLILSFCYSDCYNQYEGAHNNDVEQFQGDCFNSPITAYRLCVLKSWPSELTLDVVSHDTLSQWLSLYYLQDYPKKVGWKDNYHGLYSFTYIIDLIFFSQFLNILFLILKF